MTILGAHFDSSRPTLRAATDKELLSEIARRLARGKEGVSTATISSIYPDPGVLMGDEEQSLAARSGKSVGRKQRRDQDDDATSPDLEGPEHGA